MWKAVVFTILLVGVSSLDWVQFLSRYDRSHKHPPSKDKGSRPPPKDKGRRPGAGGNTIPSPATPAPAPAPDSGISGNTLTGLSRDDVRYFVSAGSNNKVSLTYTNGVFSFSSNGVPNHEWDDSVNQNALEAKTYSMTMSDKVSVASPAGCLPGGAIGYFINGVPLYNPLTSRGVNAAEGRTEETTDSCDGHSDSKRAYHYHKYPKSSCLKLKNEVDEFVGVALDGFPILGPTTIDASGNKKNLSTADLDECHGQTTADGRYRYRATEDFPYLLGCFKGKVEAANNRRNQIQYNCNNKVGDLCTCNYGTKTKDEVTFPKLTATRALHELLYELFGD